MSEKYLSLEINRLKKENDALRAQLAEAQAEVERLNEALTCIIDNISEMSPNELIDYAEAMRDSK